jgi:hypothetical protein
MRTLLLASASLLLIGGTALAQDSNSPLSTKASNTSAANTHGDIAPRLPVSATDDPVNAYLSQAQQALRGGRTGAAQEDLERAETRALDRVTAPAQASVPDNSPRIAAIRQARDDLGRGDRKGALQAIQTAMSTPAATTSADNAATTNTDAPAGGPSTASTPWPGPAPAAGVKPGTLGGIATSVGSPGGTGADAQTNHPMPSFSGPAQPLVQGEPSTNPSTGN